MNLSMVFFKFLAADNKLNRSTGKQSYNHFDDICKFTNRRRTEEKQQTKKDQQANRDTTILMILSCKCNIKKETTNKNRQTGKQSYSYLDDPMPGSSGHRRHMMRLCWPLPQTCVVLYCIVFYCLASYCVGLCLGLVLYCVVLYFIVLYHIVLASASDLCCIVFYCIASYCVGLCLGHGLIQCSFCLH